MNEKEMKQKPGIHTLIVLFINFITQDMCLSFLTYNSDFHKTQK